jgi:hypothetical protein
MYPGRYEQTQETESKADLQMRLLAAVAAMVTIICQNSMAMAMAMETAMITLHIPS